MATFHLTLNSVQRSAGRSSVAAAAYISGQKIKDERQGMTFDYTRKERVLSSEVIGPSGAALDRESFWNAVEKNHKRGDAVTARTAEIALPKELDEKEAKRLAQDFGKELAKHYSVGVDMALHKGKNGYYHAHYLASACRVNEDGTLGKKVVELDAKHCQCHQMETPAEVLRPYWQDLCNTRLKELGIDASIDHRSYAERGIDKLAQIKEGHGPDAAIRREVNEQIAITNSEKNLAPEKAMEAPPKEKERQKEQPLAPVKEEKEPTPEKAVEPPQKEKEQPKERKETKQKTRAESIMEDAREALAFAKENGNAGAKQALGYFKELEAELAKEYLPKVEAKRAEAKREAEEKLRACDGKEAAFTQYMEKARSENPNRFVQPTKPDPREDGTKRTIFNAKEYDKLVQQHDDLKEYREFKNGLSKERGAAQRTIDSQKIESANAFAHDYAREYLRQIGAKDIRDQVASIERKTRDKEIERKGIERE